MQQNFDKADNLAKGNHWIQKNHKLRIFLWQNATLNEKKFVKTFLGEAEFLNKIDLNYYFRLHNRNEI